MTDKSLINIESNVFTPQSPPFGPILHQLNARIDNRFLPLKLREYQRGITRFVEYVTIKIPIALPENLQNVPSFVLCLYVKLVVFVFLFGSDNNIKLPYLFCICIPSSLAL